MKARRDSIMKILITGSNGQLGNELQKIVSTGKAEIGSVSEEIKNAEVFAMDVDTLDITNLEQVKKVLNEVKPDVVINCAAATNVDGCEANQDLAFKINSLGPRNLAMVAEELGAKIVQVSTDYVFSGVGEAPLKECDLVAPVSVYGKTKLLGEEFVRDFSTKYYIVRTAWLYGYVGHNFVYTMMKLGKDRDTLNVVNDQLGNPTHANDLAYHILKLIQTEEYGVYHCTGKGECSWYNFASEIMKLSGRNCTVNPCTSEEYKSMYPNSADRPAYSSLDNMMLRCTIGDEMRDWKDALKTFMDNVEK
jgi:dTDP-4-dehydrorhamnose reductase